MVLAIVASFEEEVASFEEESVMAVAAPPRSPEQEPLAPEALDALIEEARRRARLTDASVSIVDVDGSHRRLLVENASAPAWSPDGARIAYHAGCGGIGLVTPAGADATPEAPAFGCRATAIRRGKPVWSPDGRKLAVANALGS
jgi:hypothetical protein